VNHPIFNTARFFTILALLITLPALGNTPNPCPSPEVKSTYKVDNRSYEKNLSGLEDYLDDLAKTNPSVHDQLKAELQSLRTRNTISMISLLSMGGVGLFMVSFGTAGGLNNNYLLTTFGGAAIAVTGIVLATVIHPTDRDIKKFVDHHNTLNPEHPITPEQSLKLSLGPVPGGAGAFLSFNF
jgi:hypothetical protein